MPESHNTSTSKIKLHIHTIPKIKEEEKEPENHKVRNYQRNSRREPVQWTEEEVESLKKGIADVGLGRWKTILDRYRDKFHKSRIPSDLSDKHRLMSGKGSYTNSSKTKFVEVDDNGEVCCNAMGEYRIYSERFPHGAAVRVGNLRISNDVREATINIQGKKNGVLTRHKYRIFVENKKVRAKKLFSVIVEDENTKPDEK